MPSTFLNKKKGCKMTILKTKDGEEIDEIEESEDEDDE